MKGLASTFSAILLVVSVPVSGGAANGDRAAPAEFSGQLGFGPCFGRLNYEWAERVERARPAAEGRYCKPRIIEPFTDPRLQGEVFVWEHSDQHMHGPTITHSGFSIINAEGAWQQVPGISIDFSDRSDSTGTFTLVGSGGYEGLVAIAEIGLEQDVWAWRGWIIDGELPPSPEPPAEMG